MSSKDGSSWKASLRSGTTRSLPCSSDSSSTQWPEEIKKKKKKSARKPKRTSFACLECSKTFPSQQAMAGHCSAHTRAGARSTSRHPAPNMQLPAAPPVVVAAPSNNPPPLPQCHRHVNVGRCWCLQPQLQGTSTNHMRPAPVAIRYVPYARPAISSNQMMVRLPYQLELRGRSSSVSPAAMDLAMNHHPALRPAPVHNIVPAAQLGLGAFVPLFSVAPPCGVNNGAAAPSDNVSSTNQPRHPRGDLTTPLRSGSGRDHAQKRTLPLVESLMASEGRKGKRAVVMDGGDQDGYSGSEDAIDGLDLELRLYR